MSFSRVTSLRELRRALDKAEAKAAGSTTAPLSTSTSVPAFKGRTIVSEPQKQGDDGQAIGIWVAKRLAQLDHAEHQTQFFDAHDISAASWTADEVGHWLRSTLQWEEHHAAELTQQGLTGSELLLLDDDDLHALQLPLAMRKRCLHALSVLRLRASAARGAAIAGQRAGPQRRRLACRRERLSVLYECFSKVLSHCPSVPLKTKRVLLALWQQSEAISVEAFSKEEADTDEYRRRGAQEAERWRKATRRLVEAQLIETARAEDRAEHAETLLRLERAKLEALRESVIDGIGRDGEGAAGGAQANSGARLLHAQNFEAALGEQLLVFARDLDQRLTSVGGALEHEIVTAEQEDGKRAAVLEQAETVARGLAEAQFRAAHTTKPTVV